MCILYESNGRIPSVLALSKGGSGRSRKVMVSSHCCRSPVVKEQSLAATLSVDHGSTTPQNGQKEHHIPLGKYATGDFFAVNIHPKGTRVTGVSGLGEMGVNVQVISGGLGKPY